MSSSEHIRRPTWIDLAIETPPPTANDFAERSDFPRLSTRRELQPTPEEIFQSGLVEGEQRGRDAAQKELAPVIGELREIGQSLTRVRQARLEELEGELVDLACEIARRILHSELEQPRDTAVRLARACIEAAGTQEGLVLRVAGADLELLRAHAAELEMDLAEESLRIVADPQIASGGVVLETPVRAFDGRPERMLNAARLNLGETDR